MRLVAGAALAALALGVAWAACDLWSVHRARARLRNRPLSADEQRLRDPNLSEEEWLDIQARKVKPDDAELAQYLAWSFNRLKRYDRSYPLFEIAAKGGMVSAMIQLGWMCKAGVGREKDPAGAYRWYRMAQENGNLWGDLGVASCLKEGIGVPKDPRGAFEILQRITQVETSGGSDARVVGSASYELGLLYEAGLGCASNRAEAVRCYTRAAGIPETWGADRRAYERLKVMGAPLPPPPKQSKTWR